MKSFYVERVKTDRDGFAYVFRSRESDHGFGPDFSSFGYEVRNGTVRVVGILPAFVAHDYLLERGWELMRAMSPEFVTALDSL